MKLYHKLLAFLLRFTKPGYLDESLFNQMQRINHCVSVECIVKRGNKILLQQRDSNDKFWPNEWHIPGTMVRGDELLSDALNRLFCTIIVCDEKVEIAGVLNRVYSYKTKRGNITHLLYIIEWPHKVIGSFFSIKRLPENTMEHHRLLLEGKL